MNSINNRWGIGKMLLSGLFLLMLTCIFNTSSHAQVLTPPPSNYNWKSPEDARNILLSQVTVLNQQMPGLSEGTPLHDNTVRRLAYFKAIIVDLSNGTPVVQALENALSAAATLGFEKEASYTPKVQLKALQTETRILLTN